MLPLIGELIASELQEELIKINYIQPKVTSFSAATSKNTFSGSKALGSTAASHTQQIFKYIIPSANTGGSKVYITLENAARTLIKTEEYLIQFRYAYISSTDKLSSNIIQVSSLPTNTDNSTNINIATGGTVSASNTGGGGSNMELIISYTNTISGSSVDAVIANYRVEYYGSENVSFQGL